jgi:large subunit ribosomal protein L24
MENSTLKLKIKKNDMVVVIGGKDRGKTGKVISLVKDKNRAYVSGLNIIKKHQKPTQANQKGGIIEKESSIDLSNLMLFCSKCDKGVRVKIAVDKNQKKVRQCKKCGNTV